MIFRVLYTQTGLNRFHSTDLADMREAILEEDQDGPDGGSPHVALPSVRRKESPDETP
jgi:hypothetical protein